MISSCSEVNVQVTREPQNVLIRNLLQIFPRNLAVIVQFGSEFQTKTHFAMNCLVFFAVLLAVFVASDGRSVESQTEKVIGSQQTEDLAQNVAGRNG